MITFTPQSHSDAGRGKGLAVSMVLATLVVGGLLAAYYWRFTVLQRRAEAAWARVALSRATTFKELQGTLGPPMRIAHYGPQTCWLYSSAAGMATFCSTDGETVHPSAKLSWRVAR